MKNDSGYSGFFRRFAAGLTDLAALLLVNGLIALVLSSLKSFDSHTLIMTLTMLDFGLVWLYFAFFESSKLKASPGKLLLRLTVVDGDNRRIGFARASGRTFGKLVSGMLYGFGFIMPLWTKRKQALHDFMAGTFVVMKGTEDAFFGIEPEPDLDLKMLAAKQNILADMLENGKLSREQYEEALEKVNS